MNLLTQPIMYGLGALAIAAGLFAGVQTVRLSSEKAAHAQTKTGHAEVLRGLAEMTAKTARAIRTRETDIRGLLDSSNQAREQGISHAVQEQQRIVAGVRDESVRLRKQWQGCRTASAAVPGNAGASHGIDESAELRATSAGAIVRIGDDGDIWIRSLQAYASACHALTQPLDVR
jgi:hypothetical protein